MAEELSKYFDRINIKCRYIHSDVDTMERVEIMEELRKGSFDVLVGINLLREGLDLPEVSLVAILDADKEGFLRSERSLTQTAGRAARNLNGLVIMYADKITDSMQRTIDSSNYRRNKQHEYNLANGITPTAINKPSREIIGLEYRPSKALGAKPYLPPEEFNYAADPVLAYMKPEALEKAILKTKKEMEKAAKELDFIEAARLRDEMFALQKLFKERRNG
jgi:excinuclease ABC subunit B